MAVFYLTRTMNVICRPQLRLQPLKSTFQRTHLAAECDTSSRFKEGLLAISPALLPKERGIVIGVGVMSDRALWGSRLVFFKTSSHVPEIIVIKNSMIVS